MPKMQCHGLQNILCKPIQNKSNVCPLKHYISKEIITISIKMHGTIMRQTEMKLLGTIEQKLKFGNPVNNVCIYAARQIDIISSTF